MNAISKALILFVYCFMLAIVLNHNLYRGALAAEENKFVDNGDGTITDIKNKLMWQKNDDGIEMTWNEARDYCAKLNLSGFNDWRLPKSEEVTKEVVNALMGPKRSKESIVDLYWGNDNTVLIPFNYPTSHIRVGSPIFFDSPAEREKRKAYVRAVREIEPAKK